MNYHSSSYKSYDEMRLGKPIWTSFSQIDRPDDLLVLLEHKMLKDKDAFYLCNVNNKYCLPISASNCLSRRNILWTIDMFKNNFREKFGRPITKTVVYDTGIVVFEIYEG